MYKLHELGDCFLITFTTGAAKGHMLIDCGSFRNNATSITRLTEIVTQIEDDLNGDPLSVVVGTHQHNDHLSGFVHCKTQFDGLQVRQVWLSWLDNPRDRLARRLGDDYNNLRLHLMTAAASLLDLGARPERKSATTLRSIEQLTDTMGFSGFAADGAPPEVPAKATAILKKLGSQRPEYLRPGRVLEVPGLPADSVRVHVLGPPRDETALFRKDPRSGESYDHLLASTARLAGQFARGIGVAAGAVVKTEEDRQYPFAERHKRPVDADAHSAELTAVRDRYKSESWRGIDDAWLEQAAGMALYLDDFTNNSSLVLAIELVDSGKVLLFAADAQTGNWDSWEKVKWPKGHPGTDDLLARTVFYKVGHHASHNATLVKAFEKTGGADLCALIPVHKKDPNITKKNGWKMPAKKLMKRLVERTQGRVLQMDGVNPTTCDPSGAAAAAWAQSGHVVDPNAPNAIHVTIKG